MTPTQRPAAPTAMITLLTEADIRTEPTMAAHTMDATSSVTTPTANKTPA
jgi:hypothetical protein